MARSRTPKAWCDYQADLIGHPNYDVPPDGQRFLMIQLTETGDHVNVILNGFEELEARAPTGNRALRFGCKSAVGT